MLAVVLLAAVTTCIYYTWSVGLRGWKDGSDAADSLQKTRAIAEGISEMVRGAVLYNQSDEDTENDNLYTFEGIHGTYGENDADSLTFVTLSSRFLRPYEAERSPLRRVRISLEQDENRKPYLAMFSFNALKIQDEEPAPQKLSDDVVGFRVRYYDREVDEWQEDWADASSLPSQVEITVSYLTESGQTQVSQQCITPLPAREAADVQEANKPPKTRTPTKKGMTTR